MLYNVGKLAHSDKTLFTFFEERDQERFISITAVHHIDTIEYKGVNGLYAFLIYYKRSVLKI